MLKALLLENYLVFTPLVSYLVAQVLKLILYSIVNKKFDYIRLLGSGGMPSSHSATVVALFTAALRKLGPASPTTAITLILATIVIYDARGVRQEAGKHAQVLNELVNMLHGKTEDGSQIQLNEMIGHTGLQVLVGSVLGAVITLCIPVF